MFIGTYGSHRSEKNLLLNEKLEFNNPTDKHAVKVAKGDKTVGHLPHEFSRVAWYFLGRSGEISVEVIGCRQHYKQLCGGMKVPCQLDTEPCWCHLRVYTFCFYGVTLVFIRVSSETSFILKRLFFYLARLFFIQGDSFLLGATFLFGATFFYSARLFLFGPTFFHWRDFFYLARLFYSAQLIYYGATFCCCSFSYQGLKHLFEAVFQQHGRDCSGS